MNAAPRTSASAALARAKALAEAGQADAALAAARALVAEGEALEPGERAEAMLCIAVIELRLLGRFAQALEFSQRAALVFQGAQDIAGECRALATHAVAATRLGHHERAIENALLAVRLSEALPVGPEQVAGFHALAIAAHSGRSFGHARSAYQQAIQIAQRCTPPLSTFELHVDLAATEALRYFNERNAGGSRLSLEPLERHVTQCLRMLASAPGDISLAPMSHANNLLVLSHAHCAMLAWQGRTAEAREALRRFAADSEQFQRPWLRAALQWDLAEVALAEGDLPAADACAAEVVAIADLYGHESLVSIGYQLISHVREVAGDQAGASRALREMIGREQKVRADSLESRVEAIEWQLTLRQDRARLQRLEADKRLFERLAMEDALTGLANRRQFEACLVQLLADDRSLAGPLCLATIDVDRFKRINDELSHQVGDDVLKAIADTIRAQLRSRDLAARLGGDEFAIVLHETDLDAARAIAERIRHAVASTDWAALTKGLGVSVSIGVVEAREGDTLTDLAGRSDAAMYAHKRDGRRTD